MVHHDESLGLVLVDRNTVAVGLGDVTLSFGAYPAEARGLVRFMHPLHNFAILSYDVADLNAKVSFQPYKRAPQAEMFCACFRHDCASPSQSLRRCRHNIYIHWQTYTHVLAALPDLPSATLECVGAATQCDARSILDPRLHMCRLGSWSPRRRWPQTRRCGAASRCGWRA